ncbi:MAG TPA: bifunctional serine/threonine-protein kinase/ABC transporter substrate-binding protein, partial [Aggregatilineales bacterium]|nr:bifunctional serine/threonine-protein kinase/ABC transporter substrate-binding protein [Aggregatilineales bacterium]
MPDPLIGRKIGQYEILELIGQGGMGVVYRAHQGSMKRDVAMKIVSALLSTDPNFMQRFSREVELIAQLEHSHIVPVYEHGTTDDGMTYLTMRYFKGGTLVNYMSKSSGMTLSDANRILQQVASALNYAHGRGIIHRDIKPSNILMDEEGHAYLGDFGLARLVDPEQAKTLTDNQTFLGTPTYTAPEQIQAGKSDDRSDIYSLGVVLYEMLSGRPPFVGDSTFAIMRGHLEEPPPPLSRFRPDLSPQTIAVVEKALHKNPVDRYQRVAQMADDFNEAIANEVSTIRLDRANMSAVAMPTTQVVRVGQRTGMLAAGLVILLLAGALVTLALKNTGIPVAGANVTTTVSAAASATATTADSARPASGTTDALALNAGEIAAARANLGSSFVGMVACALSTDYHASLARSVRDRAQELNLPVQVVDSNADAVKQPVLVNQLAAQGAKAIIICELDANTVGPALADVEKAGVKVVRFADTVTGPNSVALSFPNEAMGKLVGNFTGDLVNNE